MTKRFGISLLLLIGSVTAANAQCSQGDDTLNSRTNATPDFTNPCAYMRITERDTNGREYLLFGHRVKGDQQPAGQVDRRSTIHIGYSEAPRVPGLSIAITATIRNGNATTRLEVPGYSTIGDTATSAGSRLWTGNEIPGFLVGFAKVVNSVEAKLDSLRRQKQQQEQQELKTLSARYNAADTSTAQLRNDSAQIVVETRQILAKLDSSRANLSTDTTDLSAGLTERQQRMNATAHQLAALRARQQEAYLALSEYRESHETGGGDSAVIHDALGVLHSANRLKAYINSLTAGAYSSMIPTLALAGGNDPAQLKAEIAEDAAALKRVDVAFGNPTVGANIAQHRALLSETMNALRDLAQEFAALDVTNKNTAYATLSGASLHISDIDLRKVGAEKGQTITFSITTMDAQGVRRTTDVPLEVTQFGMVHDITDSFLFLRRAAMPASLDSQMVADRVAQFDNHRGLQRDLLSSEIVVPIREPATVTPGATFGWTFNARRRPGTLNGLLRVLQPGIGINASFPTYSNQRIHIVPPDTAVSPGAGASTPAPVLAGAKLSGPPTTDHESLGIGTGLMVSLFDNALAATYGWNLTTTSKYRGYYGFGISFLSLAQKAKTTYNKLIGGS